VTIAQHVANDTATGLEDVVRGTDNSDRLWRQNLIQGHTHDQFPVLRLEASATLVHLSISLVRYVFTSGGVMADGVAEICLRNSLASGVCMLATAALLSMSWIVLGVLAGAARAIQVVAS